MDAYLSSIQDLADRSTIAITLAPTDIADLPLVVANQAFLTMTGYSRDDVIGRNCRFLQRDQDQEEIRENIRAYISDETRGSERFRIVNFRKDGKRFINYVFMSRVRRQNDATAYFFASQFDMTAADAVRRAMAYEETLGRELDMFSAVNRDHSMFSLTSAEALAGSLSAVAQSRMTILE